MNNILRWLTLINLLIKNTSQSKRALWMSSPAECLGCKVTLCYHRVRSFLSYNLLKVTAAFTHSGHEFRAICEQNGSGAQWVSIAGRTGRESDRLRFNAAVCDVLAVQKRGCSSGLEDESFSLASCRLVTLRALAAPTCIVGVTAQLTVSLLLWPLKV